MKVHLPWHMSPMQLIFTVAMLVIVFYLVGALLGLTMFDFETTRYTPN